MWRRFSLLPGGRTLRTRSSPIRLFLAVRCPPPAIAKDSHASFAGLPVSDDVPRRTTLRALFTHYIDINAVPRRSFFKMLRHFASEGLEAEKLEEFCTPEGAVRSPILLASARSERIALRTTCTNMLPARGGRFARCWRNFDRYGYQRSIYLMSSLSFDPVNSPLQVP